jgi:5-methylcytosine-specific restriction endonuclease McrA
MKVGSDNKKKEILNDWWNTRIILEAKRAFIRSDFVKSFLAKNRIEKNTINKDGTISKSIRVSYKCANCNSEFSREDVQIDHIFPIIPVQIPASQMRWDDIFARIFCEENNLQILCKEHHKEKSENENKQRKEWLSKEKYIVYETTNIITKQRYIGYHTVSEWNDGYLGSGSLLRKDLAKHGRKNFARKVLFAFDNMEDAFKKEAELITNNVLENQDYYNIRASVPKIRKVVCHQTGEVFESEIDAAQWIKIDSSAISRALNNPMAPINGHHFFTPEEYDPMRPVFFPKFGTKIVNLCSGKSYETIKEASEDNDIDYGTMRNLFSHIQDRTRIRHIKEMFFVFEDYYETQESFEVCLYKIKCVETGEIFDSCIEAARIKRKSVANGSAVSRAIKTKEKMYGFHWERVEVKKTFNKV